MLNSKLFKQCLSTLLSLLWLKVGLHLKYRKDVFLNGEPSEDRRFLGQVTNPGARPLVDRQVADIFVVEDDTALIVIDQPHNHIKASGLTRTVWPQQADHLSALDFDADLIDYHLALIFFAQVMRCKCGHCCDRGGQFFSGQF